MLLTGCSESVYIHLLYKSYDTDCFKLFQKKFLKNKKISRIFFFLRQMLGQGCCERKHSRVESCRLGRCIISPHSERAADVVYISSFLPLPLCTGCSPCSTLGFRKQLIIFFFLFLSTNPGKRTNNKEVLLKSPVLI